MRKTDILQKAFVAEILNRLTCNTSKDLVTDFIITNHNRGYSISKNKSQAQALVDIIISNPDANWLNLFKEYKETSSKSRKLTIRYGIQRAEEYQCKLTNRPRPATNNTIWNKNYWINIGYTEEAAKQKVSEIQSANSKKHHNSSPDYKLLNPLSIKYWTNKGYTKEEAEDLRQPFVNKSTRSYKAYIEKYGTTKGLQKMQNSINKRLATMIERYGTTVTNGYVSKESLKFFIKLYKVIRRLGICREDIYWGIDGSREFATRYNGTNYFYDFTIKSKKLIIEYNNTFWHPRNGYEFVNPFIEKSCAEAKDILKYNIMHDRGFTVLIVWEDDDHQQIINNIIRRLNES